MDALDHFLHTQLESVHQVVEGQRGVVDLVLLVSTLRRDAEPHQPPNQLASS